MFKWIKPYTHNRRARVLIDNNRSKTILLRQGVPQRGALSPTLFIVFMNDLVKQLPTFVKSVMYADDLVMWSTDEYAATAQIQLQAAVNILSNLENEWCVNVNQSNIFTTLFTLSTKVKRTMGAAEAVLKNVYIGTIRPHLDYGSTTCSSAPKTSNYTLVQNQA